MKSESPITAIGYDVNGTMVDSEPLHVAAWYETLAENGRDFTELPVEFQNSMAGRKPLAIATFMVENLSLSTTPTDFLDAKHSTFMQMVSDDLRPMAGVVESVKRLGADYKLGIGTSLDREYVDLVLGILGVANDFSIIVTGDEIVNGKSHPETYLTLAERMGVVPEALAVLEDAWSGIRSAKSAGCWCIAVENSHAAAQDTSEADKIVYSLNEVTTDLIRTLA